MIRLTPGDKAFFGMLSELAERVTSASTLLTDLCENPDQLDISRENARRHLSFGYGIHRCVRVIETGVARLEDPASLVEGISDAWRLEEEADAIYTGAIRQLFSGQPDPMDVLKRKELYDVLETAIDLSKVVAKVLTSIAVKRL